MILRSPKTLLWKAKSQLMGIIIPLKKGIINNPPLPSQKKKSKKMIKSGVVAQTECFVG